MSGYGKRLRSAREGVDFDKEYPLTEALDLVRTKATAKFDETIEIAINCSVDPRKADQNVRGVVQLPEGTGRTVRVAVFARDAAAKEAEDAGADIVGAEELVDKVQAGELNFDACVATPDMMVLVGRLGKILGPRGLMPNPKLGTVTPDVAKAIKAIKAGQVEFRTEKGGVIHAVIGKASFSVEALEKNFKALWDAIIGAKPQVIKKALVERMAVSSTMGIGVRVSLQGMEQ